VHLGFNAFRLKTVAKFLLESARNIQFRRNFATYLFIASFQSHRCFADSDAILRSSPAQCNPALKRWLNCGHVRCGCAAYMIRNSTKCICQRLPPVLFMTAQNLDEPNNNVDLFICQPPPPNQCQIYLRHRIRSPKTTVMRSPRTL
jgi:hypothetical protein